MSYTLITQAARDKALTDRTLAAAQQEARNNPTYGDTELGRQIIGGNVLVVGTTFNFPVAIDGAAAYESAVIAGNPNPGGDPSVITDAQILSSVQAAWPMDEEPPA
jgi:hypothetical protein